MRSLEDEGDAAAAAAAEAETADELAEFSAEPGSPRRAEDGARDDTPHQDTPSRCGMEAVHMSKLRVCEGGQQLGGQGRRSLSFSWVHASYRHATHRAEDGARDDTPQQDTPFGVGGNQPTGWSCMCVHVYVGVGWRCGRGQQLCGQGGSCLPFSWVCAACRDPKRRAESGARDDASHQDTSRDVGSHAVHAGCRQPVGACSHGRSALSPAPSWQSQDVFACRVGTGQLAGAGQDKQAGLEEGGGRM